MTIECLLECSADELEKMTDAELKAHFAPYLQFTRPELIQKSSVTTKRNISTGSYRSEKNEKKQKANDILKQLGIDLKI